MRGDVATRCHIGCLVGPLSSRARPVVEPHAQPDVDLNAAPRPAVASGGSVRVVCSAAAATGPAQVLVRQVTTKSSLTPACCSRHSGRGSLDLHGECNEYAMHHLGTAARILMFACCSSANMTNRPTMSSGASVLCLSQRGCLRYVRLKSKCYSAQLQLSWPGFLYQQRLLACSCRPRCLVRTHLLGQGS